MIVSIEYVTAWNPANAARNQLRSRGTNTSGAASSNAMIRYCVTWRIHVHSISGSARNVPRRTTARSSVVEFIQSTPPP
jgi:hypothetical protein